MKRERLQLPAEHVYRPFVYSLDRLMYAFGKCRVGVNHLGEPFDGDARTRARMEDTGGARLPKGVDHAVGVLGERDDGAATPCSGQLGTQRARIQGSLDQALVLRP